MHAMIRGEHRHGAALLWHRHAPSCSLAIGPRHPSYWQKTVKKSLQLTLHLAKYFMIYNWNFTKNEMSGINWAVESLTLTICTELNGIELSLWDLSYCVALRELKCAIYDGLEMKFKVTRMIVWDNYIPSTVQWWWWMICWVVLCLLSSSISDEGSWKESKKSLKLYCCVLFHLFLFQMVLKGVHILNVMYESQGSWKESKIHCRMVLKELIFSKEVSHGEWKHCLSDAGVLKWVQDALCEIVLK